MRALSKLLVELGAREVKTAVLIRRVIENPIFMPDWIGFNHKGPEWFVGYGMDDSNRFSNLSDIYVIQKAVDES